MPYKGLLDLQIGETPDTFDKDMYNALYPLHNALNLINQALQERFETGGVNKTQNLFLDQSPPVENPEIFALVQPLYNAAHMLNSVAFSGGGTGFSEIREVKAAWYINKGAAVTFLDGGSRRPPGVNIHAQLNPNNPDPPAGTPHASAWLSRVGTYQSNWHTYPVNLYSGVAVPGGLHPPAVYGTNFSGGNTDHRLLGIALNDANPGETVQVGMGPGIIEVEGAQPGDVYSSLSYIGRLIPNVSLLNIPRAHFGQSLLGTIFKGRPSKISGDPNVSNPRWRTFETYYTVVGECLNEGQLSIYPAGSHVNITI